MNAATEIEHAGADIDEARGHSAADVATGDPLLDASRLLRQAVDRYPVIAKAVAEVDAAIGCALAERREAERETRTHLAAIRRALAGVERALAAGGGEAEPTGEPTQVTALRVAAELVASCPPATMEVNTWGRVHVRLAGGDGEKLAAMAAYAARLSDLRDFWAPRDEHTGRKTQVYITGDYPGAHEVTMVAVLAGDPDAEALDKLRALCADETAEGEA